MASQCLQITFRSLAFQPCGVWSLGPCRPNTAHLHFLAPCPSHAAPSAFTQITLTTVPSGRETESFSVIHSSEWLINLHLLPNDCKFHEGKSQVNFAHNLSPGPRKVSCTWEMLGVCWIHKWLNKRINLFPLAHPHLCAFVHATARPECCCHPRPPP